ncbi:MAG: hypothetical protein F6K30_02945 [Cyanothece sp. SIO2G6]|nr:hypothetical protein [Cyanothece sp. SIO2G6]
MSNLDLWPDNLLEEIPRSPLEILSSQAALLGSKTQNIILADVASTINETGKFILCFYLRVPSLSNYQFDLFSVWHGIDLYPVHDTATERALKNEQQLINFIVEKLNDKRTVKIIRALAAQTRKIKPFDDIPF